MMNFEEWFKQSGINDRTYFTSKEVWDACKNEVLKIINSPKIKPEYNLNLNYIKQEINKL